MFNRPIHKQPFSLPKGITLPDSGPPLLENVSHMPGQAAAIRFFNPHSEEDLEAMREILKGKQVRKWMDDVSQISRSEYRDWAETFSNTSFLFAVLDARISNPAEIKQVRGFVYIYSEREEKFRVRRMERLGFIEPSEQERYLLEVSFAVRPLVDGQQSGSGLMSSALRQACLQVHTLLTSPERPIIKIFAFVAQENIPAQRTLESSGFIRKGVMKYDWDSYEETALYILSWRLLRKKVKEKLLELNRSTAQPANAGIVLPQFIQQTESHCGPAVVQALLTFLDQSLTQDQIVAAAEVAHRIMEHGTRPDQLATAVSKLAPDLQFWFKQPTSIEDLTLLIHKYRWPVAVNWQGLFYDTLEEEMKNNPDGERGHYSVVVNIDPSKNEITLADPYPDYSSKPRVFSLQWFIERWWDVDHEVDTETGKKSSIYTKHLSFIISPKEARFPVELRMQLPDKLDILNQ